MMKHFLCLKSTIRRKRAYDCSGCTGKPPRKIRIGGTKDCNNEFILLSAISLLVYVSKKENLGVDELLDNCHLKIKEMKVKNL